MCFTEFKYESVRLPWKRVAALDPGEPVVSVVDADKHASIGLHLAVGFTQTERVEEYAGITFAGGRGVVMVHEPAPGAADE